ACLDRRILATSHGPRQRGHTSVDDSPPSALDSPSLCDAEERRGQRTGAMAGVSGAREWRLRERSWRERQSLTDMSPLVTGAGLPDETVGMTPPGPRSRKEIRSMIRATTLSRF